MKKSSRYIFGAGMAAAGLLPLVDGVAKQADAAPITAAGFTFEGSGFLTTTATLSYSYAAELGSGTITLNKSAGTINSVGGNPGKALTGNNMYSSSYTFAFNIDNINSIGVSFDMTGSATGPRDFVVQYSADGVNFSDFGSVALAATTVTATNIASSTTFTSTTFASGANATGFNFAFSAPTAFGDLSTVAGDVGYLRILQSGATAINGGGPATGGTNRIDNIFITGNELNVVPEPAAASLVPLAAAALLFRRRQQA